MEAAISRRQRRFLGLRGGSINGKVLLKSMAHGCTRAMAISHAGGPTVRPL